MRRRFNRIDTRPRSYSRSAATAPNDDSLPIVGAADGRYFPRAEAVTLTFGRADLEIIKAALIAANNPETVPLLRRVRCG